MVYWHVAKEISFKDIYIFTSGGHVVQLSFSLINFDRRHHEGHFFESTLNLDQLFRRRGHLKIILIYSFGGLFVQSFQTICAIMVVGLMRNISVK